MSRRDLRLGEAVKEAVAEIILYEMKDPRLERVTVTAAQLTRDLKRATVYVTILGTPAEEKAGFEALRKATGFVKIKLAERLDLRYMPELVFEVDTLQKTEARIDELLRAAAADRDRGE